MKKLFQKIINFCKDLAQKSKTALMIFVNKIKQLPKKVKALWKSFIGGVLLLAKKIKQLGVTVVEKVKYFFKNPKQVLTSLWQKIKHLAFTVWQAIKKVYYDIPRYLRLPVLLAAMMVAQLFTLSFISPQTFTPAATETAEYSVTYKGMMDSHVLYEQTFTEKDEEISFKAIDLYGYQFVGWDDGVTTPTRTDNEFANGKTFVARYTVHPDFIAGNYTLFYEGHAGEYVFYHDSVVTKETTSNVYTAREVLGYEFVGWNDGVKTPTRTDAISNAGKTLVAMYEAKPLDAPVVQIFTEELKDVVSKTEYLTCTFSLSNANADYCKENLSAKVRGRGTSSWTMPKKSFRVRFDEAQSMFGSDYVATDWTLIANYADKTLSRNALAQEFASRFEDIPFASNRQFVELYVNYEYLGVYLLCDQIEAKRLGLSEEIAEDGNNDYLIELNGNAAPNKENEVEGVECFRLNDNFYYYSLKSPDVDDPSYDAETQIGYIRNYLNTAMNSINANVWDVNWDYVCSLIDVDSFADAYILEELFANVDSGWTDFYLIKKKDGKLQAGPVWDFDISSGNDNYAMGNTDTCPPDSSLYVATDNPWFKKLCKIPEFKTLVTEKLVQYQPIVEEVLVLLDPQINNTTSVKSGYYALYRQSIERNFLRWDILNEQLGQEPNDLAAINTIEGQLTFLKDWLSARYAYMCAQYDITI